MATIFWPSSLPPTLLMEGLTIEPQNNVIRTAMDAGPQKIRRRYTARTVKFSGRFIFDASQFAVFESFYHTALADGVLRFNFTNPITLETAEFRFAENYTASAIDGFFEVALKLEKL